MIKSSSAKFNKCMPNFVFTCCITVEIGDLLFIRNESITLFIAHGFKQKPLRTNYAHFLFYSSYKHPIFKRASKQKTVLTRYWTQIIGEKCMRTERFSCFYMWNPFGQYPFAISMRTASEMCVSTFLISLSKL